MSIRRQEGLKRTTYAVDKINEAKRIFFSMQLLTFYCVCTWIKVWPDDIDQENTALESFFLCRKELRSCYCKS